MFFEELGEAFFGEVVVVLGEGKNKRGQLRFPLEKETNESKEWQASL